MGSEVVETFFNSAMSRVFSQLTDVEYLQHEDALMTQLNVFATGRSGWVVEALTWLEIKTVSCSKVTGGSDKQTPPILKPLNRSILSVVNKVITSASCIVSQLLYSLPLEELIVQRPTKKIQLLPFNSKLMPMPLSAIPSFEKRNRSSSNVF